MDRRVKLAANSRLKAVCAAADLLRLVVNLLDRIEHRLRVGRGFAVSVWSFLRVIWMFGSTYRGGFVGVFTEFA
jgi:hypothetical protein